MINDRNFTIVQYIVKKTFCLNEASSQVELYKTTYIFIFNFKIETS